MTSAELRRKAADLIPDARHWSSNLNRGGVPHGYGHPVAGTLCLVGALHVAAGGRWGEAPTDLTEPTIEAAVKDMGFESVRDAERWNDHSATYATLQERLRA